MDEVQTIRRAVITDAAVVTLLGKIIDMPGRIQTARENLTHAEFELSVFNDHELAKEKVDELELEATFEVTQETEDNGKKKYANVEQRKAAAASNLSKSQEYLDAKNKLIQAKTTKAEIEMKVHKLKDQLYFGLDEFKAQMAIAGLAQGLCHENENSRVMQQVYKQKDKLATAINQLREGLSDV